MLPIPPVLLYAATALAALAGAFASGYAYRAHLAAVDDAARVAQVETVVETVTKTVFVTDKAAVTRLLAQLSQAKAQARNLQAMIEDAQHAQPTAVSVDCRLPDRVRDELNAVLTSGAR